MPTYNNGIVPIDVEQNYAAGVHVLHTCPAYKISSIVSIRLNTVLINTIVLTVTRVNPSGVYVVYTFNLSAGDNMVDTSGYVLKAGDSISLTLSNAATVFVKGQTVQANPQVF